MSRSEKRFMRKIIRASASKKETPHGHPEHFEFILECGHKAIRWDNPHWSVMLFAFKNGGEPKMNCRDCAEGKDPFEPRLIHLNDIDVATHADTILLDVESVPNELYRDSSRIKVEFFNWLSQKKDMNFYHLRMFKFTFLDYRKKAMTTTIANCGKEVAVPKNMVVCYVAVSEIR